VKQTGNREKRNPFLSQPNEAIGDIRQREGNGAFFFFFFFFFAVLGLELKTFTFSHSSSPIFVKGFSR
jgi:hypothetical protein